MQQIEFRAELHPFMPTDRSSFRTLYLCYKWYIYFPTKIRKQGTLVSEMGPSFMSFPQEFQGGLGLFLRPFLKSEETQLVPTHSITPLRSVSLFALFCLPYSSGKLLIPIDLCIGNILLANLLECKCWGSITPSTIVALLESKVLGKAAQKQSEYIYITR